jgi:hypothetical protein
MSLRNLQIPSAIQSKLGVAQIFDITDQLPKNPNYTWSQLAAINDYAEQRDINDLDIIGLHHDAWPKKNRAAVDDITFAREIAQDHIDYKGNEKKGDAGFPYHLWIRNGKIYQTNDLLDRVYGIGGQNGHVIHICVSGDYYSYDSLTDPDRNALYAAIFAVKAVMPSYAGIKGHCEYNPKNCPGFDHKRVKVDIPRIELEIKAAGDPSQIMNRSRMGASQHTYLYNQYAADPVANKWLESYLLKMDEVTRDMGMYFGK